MGIDLIAQLTREQQIRPSRPLRSEAGPPPGGGQDASLFDSYARFVVSQDPTYFEMVKARLRRYEYFLMLRRYRQRKYLEYLAASEARVKAYREYKATATKSLERYRAWKAETYRSLTRYRLEQAAHEKDVARRRSAVNWERNSALAKVLGQAAAGGGTRNRSRDIRQSGFARGSGKQNAYSARSGREQRRGDISSRKA